MQLRTIYLVKLFAEHRNPYEVLVYSWWCNTAYSSENFWLDSEFFTIISRRFYSRGINIKFRPSHIAKQIYIYFNVKKTLKPFYNGIWVTYPTTTITKSNKFHPFLTYALGCNNNPYAIIFKNVSTVKIIRKAYSTFSCKRQRKSTMKDNAI